MVHPERLALVAARLAMADADGVVPRVIVAPAPSLTIRGALEGAVRGRVERAEGVELDGHAARGVAVTAAGTFARTIAAASGGQTELPTMRPCAALVSGLP